MATSWGHTKSRENFKTMIRRLQRNKTCPRLVPPRGKQKKIPKTLIILLLFFSFFFHYLFLSFHFFLPLVFQITNSLLSLFGKCRRVWTLSVLLSSLPIVVSAATIPFVVLLLLPLTHSCHAPLLIREVSLFPFDSFVLYCLYWG